MSRNYRRYRDFWGTLGDSAAKIYDETEQRPTRVGRSFGMGNALIWMQIGRDVATNLSTGELFRRRFLVDDDFQMRGHVLMQLDRHSELAQGLQRLVQLDLAPIHVEALLDQRIRQVARSH